jgi:hypothetical protein
MTAVQTANVGMFLSPDSIYDEENDTLDRVPQIASDSLVILNDTLNWTRIYGTFKAVGGEQFLVIGNFLANAQTNVYLPDDFFNEAYYYIDDVSVRKCSDTLTSNALVTQRQTTINIQPNPASTISQLHWNGYNGNGFVIVSDLNGRAVSTKPFTTTNTTTIDVSQLANGMYFVKLVDAINGTLAVTKLVVNR